jgi:hypothetical protein
MDYPTIDLKKLLADFKAGTTGPMTNLRETRVYVSKLPENYSYIYKRVRCLEAELNWLKQNKDWEDQKWWRQQIELSATEVERLFDELLVHNFERNFGTEIYGEEGMPKLPPIPDLAEVTSILKSLGIEKSYMAFLKKKND